MGKTDKIIEETFDKVIQDEFSSISIAARYIAKKFKLKGINLNSEQMEYIKNQLRNGNATLSELEFTEGQARRVGNRTVHIDLNVEEFEEYYKKFTSPELLDEVAEAVLSKTINHLAKTYLRANNRVARNTIAADREGKRKFDCLIKQVWGKAIYKLEKFVSISDFVCVDVFPDVKDDIVKQTPFLDTVLSGIQARCCQIAREIILLLKSGYADGAHARWRSLYELTVISSFIYKHGEEAAERYYDFQAIEYAKDVDDYQTFSIRYSYKPLDTNEITELENEKNSIILKYSGEAFTKENGWARKFLPNQIGKKDRITFREIEESVGLESLRFLYRRACDNIHAGPRSIFNRLGVSIGDSAEPLFLSGPSIFGLAHPGHDTAYCLLLSTSNYLRIFNTLDAEIIITALSKLNDEVFEAFRTVEDEQENTQIDNRPIIEEDKADE